MTLPFNRLYTVADTILLQQFTTRSGRRLGTSLRP